MTPGRPPHSGRMILVEPGLAQHLVALAEVAAHLHRVRAGGGEIELRAPMAGHVVGHRLGQDIGEAPARGRQDRLRDHALWQPGQRLAHELHHEFAHALRPGRAGLAAIAEAGRDARGRAASDRARRPTSACDTRNAKLLPAQRGLGRHPHGHDVVVDLVVGGDLDELDRAPVPVALWLDPERGTAVVIDAVEIMVEIAVALEQAEALRVGVA